MKLIVFPGGGSPRNPKYVSVYRLIEQAARDRGYEHIDISTSWPGHESKGVLTMDSALEVARRKVDELESDNTREQYDFLARSFGCYVALKVALDKKPERLRRIILWGPPPYWLMWEMWVKDLDENQKKAMEKGLAVDESLFPTIVPLEQMLPQMHYETIVATGAQDPYVSASYLRYLESIVMERRSSRHCQSIRFMNPVPGAVHEVTEDAPEPVKAAYIAALFAENTRGGQ